MGRVWALFILGLISAAAASADPVDVRAGDVVYTLDPATLQIDAKTADGTTIAVMPPLHAAEQASITTDSAGLTWTDADGHVFHLSTEAGALHLTVTGQKGASLAWNMPKVASGTWLVPDGEGMAYNVDDPFWRLHTPKEKCLDGDSSLSFPAWSYLTDKRAVTYALGDGFSSQLCLRDDAGLQTKLTHRFDDGAETLDLSFTIGPPDPLAPALFYRELLKGRGEFNSFADKEVPDLPRLFAAPQIYVWGTGHNLAFLDDLKNLGITRAVVTVGTDRTTNEADLSAYFKKAYALGYLAGPYDEFGNAQPEKTADDPTSIWPGDLYPKGCVRKADGSVMAGFAGRGCNLSSEALVMRKPFEPAVRYARHVADGASEVFVDSDAFGEFYADYDPAHPMSMAKDRDNLFARLELGIARFHLVIGSEKVVAWSAPVTHFSHGTLEVHQSTIWPLLKNPQFGGWWPGDEPPLFFKPYTPTPDEAHELFSAADRLPLFEAVFHDSVVTSDRWEFGLMKIVGQERYRFALSLLYGTPTMWNLNRRELQRVGPWLKAAQDDFRAVHGIETPVALTGFAWATHDRLVQKATYADGTVVIANFGQDPWQGLASDCVRVSGTDRAASDFCPPPEPAPYKRPPYHPKGAENANLPHARADPL